jgi:acetyl esterase/lipase
VTPWGFMDPELAASLALLDEVDPYDLVAHRAYLRKNWATQTHVPYPQITLGYLDSAAENDAPPVKLRTYWNADADPLAPAVVWLHGGGFALGFCELDDDLCAWLATEVGCHVIAPEYRLAPENPFPAGFDDAYDTVEWVTHQASRLGVDPHRIAVAGGSAGGALAATVCQRARDEGGPVIACQLLVYPVIDDRMRTESMRLYTDTPIFDRPAAELMWERYLGPQRTAPPPYAAPMRAASLAGLPAAYVLTADIDPLRDEGLAYATRLIADGVETELHHFPGAFHGFDTVIPTALIAQRAWADYANALRRAFSR